ncbi:hypothetical protein [Actinomyces sp.]|uniref:hypothetical protein n=1 Tax=Actinomyces sp. TaxID=29317 RepID=UPI001EB30375|nr:hypothetical protein [Actinomyces sp.]MBS5825881.1 hypothetical protein [Actinomyces sp.]MDU4286177.1 hypothetical protein [Actinomyces sp.]
MDKLIVFGKSIAGIRTLPFTTTITYEPPLYTGLVALALFAAFFFYPRFDFALQDSLADHNCGAAFVSD